jgi:thiosulfate/3-mercaptopyruvate sulfurtransferase
VGQAHGSDPGVVLVEVDEDTSAYDTGHIAGAVKIDWKTDLQDPVRRDFVDRPGFPSCCPSRGIANDDTVVLYGGNNNWFAAYAYWYFKLYGHDNVKLLDGGRKKWELESRELSERGAEPPGHELHRVRAGRHDPGVPRRGSRRDRQARTWSTSAPRTSSPGGCSRRRICRRSRRSAAATSHRAERPVVQGRQRGRHLQVRRRTAHAVRDEAGLDFGKDTIAYCRIGERSAHTWFVLHELLEQPNVKNYDGSWTEYGSLVGVPIELGDAR